MARYVAHPRSINQDTALWRTRLYKAFMIDLTRNAPGLQLCYGASDEERKRWSLKRAEEFHYLNQSTCYDLPRTNNAKEYEVLSRSCSAQKRCALWQAMKNWPDAGRSLNVFQANRPDQIRQCPNCSTSQLRGNDRSSASFRSCRTFHVHPFPCALSYLKQWTRCSKPSSFKS